MSTKAEWDSKIKESIRKANDKGVKVQTLGQFGYWVIAVDGTKKRATGSSKLLSLLEPYQK